MGYGFPKGACWKVRQPVSGVQRDHINLDRFMRCRRQAPTGRHANPTLAGGSDDEAARTDRCGQERLLCGGQTRIRNDRHSRPTAQNDSLPASTVMGGKHVGPLFCFRPRRCRRGLCGRSRRPGWALPGGCGISANNCAASMRTFTAPTRRGGRSSIRESCLTRCPLLRTGRASAARGSMCEVTGWATPTGSNEPLYGRTDTKSRTVEFLDGQRRWRGGRFEPP